MRKTSQRQPTPQGLQVNVLKEEDYKGLVDKYLTQEDPTPK